MFKRNLWDIYSTRTQVYENIVDSLRQVRSLNESWEWAPASRLLFNIFLSRYSQQHLG